MAATIDTLLLDRGPDVYYTDGLRNVLEDHMTYLRTASTTLRMEVTPMQAHRYELDLMGLLNELNIPLRLHWVVARMNNFDSLHDVPADLTALLVPDEKEVNRLVQSYTSTTRV